MARKVSTRVVMNRRTLSAIDEGFVQGFEAIGQKVIATTKPPDAAPFGQGLVTTGAYGVWANNRKVAGPATKPRGARFGQGVHLFIGYGFPARFQELGTVKQPARPFLGPVMDSVMPSTPQIVAPYMKGRLAREPK
jgi:hypothetical protein